MAKPHTGVGGQSRWDAVMGALRAIQGRLRPHDRIGVVTFTATAEVVTASPVAPGELSAVLSGLTAPTVTGTHIGRGLAKAHELMVANRRAGVPVTLVLLTDGHSLDPEAGHQAVQAAALAGFGFVAMGFGVSWHSDYLRSLSARLMHVVPEFIEDDTRAVQIFQRVLARQQQTVLAGVRLCGVLNTQHIEWTAVASEAPERTGPRPIHLEDDRPLGNGVTGKAWTAYIGNVEAGVPHAHVLTGRPCLPLPRGRHPLGRFWLEADLSGCFGKISGECIHVLEVGDCLQVNAATPENRRQNPLVLWKDSTIPECLSALNALLQRGDGTGVRRAWSDLVALMETLQHPGAADEAAQFAAWRAGRPPSDAEKKRTERFNTSVLAGAPAKALRTLMRAGQTQTIRRPPIITGAPAARPTAVKPAPANPVAAKPTTATRKRPVATAVPPAARKPPAPPERKATPPLTTSTIFVRRKALIDFLVCVFKVDELERFLRNNLLGGFKLLPSLPSAQSPTSLSHYVDTLVDVMERHNYIDDTFFNALRDFFVKRRHEVERIRRLYVPRAG